MVVRSVLDGLRNRNSIPDLLACLRDLPKEIKPLYEHLIDRIEPIYLEWASKALQTVQLAHRLADNPFQLTHPERGREESILPLTTEIIYFAISHEIDVNSIENLSQDFLSRTCEDLEIQFIARCACLIEATPKRKRGKEQETSGVKWFHRSARDFIENEATGTNLLNHIPGPSLTQK